MSRQGMLVLLGSEARLTRGIVLSVLGTEPSAETIYFPD